MSMSELRMKRYALAVVALLALSPAAFAADALLKLPSFDMLSDKASESVTITLDPVLLRIAAQWLDPSDPEDAAVKEVLQGIKGIYVRSFTFDTDFAYPVKDIDAVRKQLAAPGWQQLVQVVKKKEQTKIDIYMLVDANKANGLAIIASEPREFTIVNIV